MVGRRTVLALMLVGVVPAFAVVNSLVSAARARREALAADSRRIVGLFVLEDVIKTEADAAAERAQGR